MEVIKKSNKALNFIGKVRMGDGRVEINPQNDPGTRYKFARADVPKYIKKGTFFVSLSEDGSEIFAVRPYEGTFRGKFKNFFTKENEIPKPFKREAKPVAFEGKSFTVPEHLEFTCNFILTQDDYEDMPVAGYFWYDYFTERFFRKSTVRFREHRFDDFFERRFKFRSCRRRIECLLSLSDFRYYFLLPCLDLLYLFACKRERLLEGILGNFRGPDLHHVYEAVLAAGQ